MIPLNDIRNRDKQLYWSDTIVFDKAKGRAMYLAVLADQAIVQPIGGDNQTVFSLEEFSERFITHRFPVGWINCDSACMYGSSSPGRSNRKAYTFRDITVFSPIYTDASSVYSHIKRRVRREDPYFEQGIPKELADAQDLLGILAPLKANATRYFRAYNTDFYSLQDAIDLIADGTRVGCALSFSWALAYRATNREDECSIFYHDCPVATYNLTENRAIFDEDKQDLIPTWSRL